MSYSIRDYSDSFCTKFQQNYPQILDSCQKIIWKSAEIGTDTLSQGLGKVLEFISRPWDKTNPDVKKRVYTIWSYLENSPVMKDDSVQRRLQKVAFTVLISLPVALILSDYVSLSNQSAKPSTGSFTECLGYIFKSFVYMCVIDSIVDSILDHLDPQEVAS